MPLEQEVPHLLLIGFLVVTGVTAAATVFLWLKYKRCRSAYALILLQIVLLSFSFVFFMNAVTLTPSDATSMASETHSLQLGLAGVFWALSMMCFLAVIIRFTRLAGR